MIDIIKDTLIDGVKLLPFLFIAFFTIEFIEHKLSNKSKETIKKSGKLGPLFGGALGMVPQCGFSSAAANLYATKIITVGTLVAIFLSTTDEMIPILISRGADLGVVIKLIGIQAVIGVIAGFIIDFIFKNKKVEEIEDFCEHEHCDCEHKSILESSIRHTLNILAFIMIISFILNLGLYYLGEDVLANLFLKNSLFGPFVASLVGLIPNCAASVVLTELYLNSAITLGSVIAGLLTGSGVAILILFRVNKNLKENLFVLGAIYSVGVISGIIIDLIGLVI